MILHIFTVKEKQKHIEGRTYRQKVLSQVEVFLIHAAMYEESPTKQKLNVDFTDNSTNYGQK